MFDITDDPLHDFENYEYMKFQKKEYCYYCERLLINERAFRINGDLVCMDCLDYRYGEEIED